MKLVEALRILREAPPDARPFRVQLGCGFTPLHLATFLGAELAKRLPERKVVVTTGLYGDPISALEGEAEAAVLALEWSDLDARLGLRRTGGWSPSAFADVLTTVDRSLESIRRAAVDVAQERPLAISLPTLDRAPIAHHAPHQLGPFELALDERLAAFARALSETRGVRILHPRGLSSERHDVVQELATGFPYTLAHASNLAARLAELVLPPPPKKGIITDLDNTLWRGILGDVGPEGIAWENASHAHALYQQLLGALADAGVLVAVATKNDPEAVDEAFRRPELAALRKKIGPVVASWDTKSAAVATILKAWNIGADDVVMIDDSPMELAEVHTVFPQLEGLLYPTEDVPKLLALLWQLRERFGKERLSLEDAIRGTSLAATAAIEDAADPDAFLAALEAELTFDFTPAPPPRALELVNKTNQFNANGRRWTEAEWTHHLHAPNALLVQASYSDKFGPLGTISVLAGRRHDRLLTVDAWVLSCRAFSRRVEHAVLAALFRDDVDAIELDFVATPRNGPLRTFLERILGASPTGVVRIERDRFLASCPPLPHRIRRSS